MRRFLTGLCGGLLLMAGTAMAEDIIIESRAEGKNNDKYKDEGGWIDSNSPAETCKSAAPDLTPQGSCGARKLNLTMDGDKNTRIGFARFSPKAKGHFHVALTWGRAANGGPVDVMVKHAKGESKVPVTQDGWGGGGSRNPSKWISVGDYDFTGSEEEYVEIQVGPDTKAVDSRTGGQVMADAARFSTQPVGEASAPAASTMAEAPAAPALTGAAAPLPSLPAAAPAGAAPAAASSAPSVPPELPVLAQPSTAGSLPTLPASGSPLPTLPGTSDSNAIPSLPGAAAASSLPSLPGSSAGASMPSLPPPNVAGALPSLPGAGASSASSSVLPTLPSSGSTKASVDSALPSLPASGASTASSDASLPVLPSRPASSGADLSSLPDLKQLRSQETSKASEPAKPAVVELTWLTDVRQAISEGSSSGKNILVLFAGTDARSRAYERVLKSAAVNDLLASKFVLVKLDMGTNRSIANRLGIKSGGNIVLYSSKAQPLALLNSDMTAEQLRGQLEKY